MATEVYKDVVQLADQVAQGFAALSGEYQVLFDQQKQLESKLSCAKQQVCLITHLLLISSFRDEIPLALDLQLHRGFDRQQPQHT